jgi:hypothetical protein
MAFLKSIDEIRSVQWGTSNLWDMQIPSAPSPFNKWFPAVDVSENKIFSTSFTAPYFLKQYKFPQNSSMPELQITFADDEDKHLVNWLQAWHDEIYDDTDGVTCLEDAIRKISVLKLNGRRELLSTTDYYAYPEGNVTEALNSQADLKTYSLTLSVASYNTDKPRR